MFDGLIAAWQIVGQLVEKRELTSAKNPAWRGHVAKIATLGGTFECQVAPSDWEPLIPGNPYKFGGHLEDQRGNLRLIVDRIEMVNKKVSA